MKNDAIRLLNKMDIHLTRMLDVMEESEQGVWIETKPGVDEWSALEILQHLYWAEFNSLNYLQKKMKSEWSSLNKTGFLTWLRTRVILLVLFSPFKYKIPKGVQMTKKDNVPYPELKSQYLKFREELLIFLYETPEKWYGVELFKHPVFGRLSILGMLEFMEAHFSRHEKQFLNTRNKVRGDS